MAEGESNSCLPITTSTEMILSSVDSNFYTIQSSTTMSVSASPNQQNSPTNIVRNSSRKKVAERMGISSSSNNVPIQLNMQNCQQPTGDIYEFQSSPEDISAPMAPGGIAYFPTIIPAIASTSSITMQQKSASTSSIPNILASNTVKSNNTMVNSIALASPSAPKRIKTAILAKKLLAAAADSNIVDQPSTLTTSSQNEQCESYQRDDEDEGEQQKNDSMEIEEKLNTAQNEREDDEQESRKAIEDIDGAGDGEGQQQEQKKVPPLRISLVKTPSEEAEATPAAASISVAHRKNKVGGGTTLVSAIGTGRIGTRRNLSKEDTQQRVTRSRVRQNVNLNEAGDEPSNSTSSRKRRHRGDNADVKDGSVDTVVDKQYGDETQNSMGDDAGSRSEDLPSSSTTQGSVQPDSYSKEKIQQQQQLSLLIQLLSKNSLEQTVAFDAMIRDKWVRQYKQHLAYVLEKIETQSFHEQIPSEEYDNKQITENKPSKDWPETLNKLFMEQEKRRQELAEEHRLDRDRMAAMAQREFARQLEQQARLQKARAINDDGNLATGEKQVVEREEPHYFSIVSYLRDSDCNDPVFLTNTLHNSTFTGNRLLTPTTKQIQQRLTYLANTTKTRHTMEAHALLENQKAEWNRTARRTQRELEQQQLMMKGPIGKQQQQQQYVYPADLWVNSAVTCVPVLDVQIPKFLH